LVRHGCRTRWVSPPVRSGEWSWVRAKQTNLGATPIKTKPLFKISASTIKIWHRVADQTVNGHVQAAVGAPRRRGGRSGSIIVQRAAYLRLGWSSSSSVGQCSGPACVPERVTPSYGLYCRLRHLALMLPAAGVTAAEFLRARDNAARQTENRGDWGNLQRPAVGPLPLVRETDVRATDVCPPPSFVAGLAGIRARMPVGLFPSCGHWGGEGACRRCPATSSTPSCQPAGSNCSKKSAQR
jgi:hypothetical protein